jgi:hypothetical protein
MTGEDPLGDLELSGPTLAEQVAPYQKYGDDELAVALLEFQRRHSAPGLNGHARFGSPADVGANFECPNCEVNVRSVSKPNGPFTACPCCGENPGMLALGRGPQ